MSGKSNKALAGRGFTLVELLVVISIIGMLLGLLLPAIQASREAARSAQCQNNLRQIAFGMIIHEQAHGHFPTGGWGFRWQGDPDRGFGSRQPGGWTYNVLPYIEQEALRQLGAGESAPAKRLSGRLIVETALPVFNCPSRRAAQPYPFHGLDFYNIDRPAFMGRSDYAANVGSLAPIAYGSGPSSLAEGDSLQYVWTQMDRTGIVFRRSRTRSLEILDGASSTYLVGEGYLNIAHYQDGQGTNDDQGMFVGYDRDTLRCTHFDWPPSRDRNNVDRDHSFGSIHAKGFHMAFCDGSVAKISFSISPIVHCSTGERNDGRPISSPLF